VRGTPLYSDNPLEFERWLLLGLRSITEGLAFMHDAGVVHGDVKPQNMVLDKVTARLLDKVTARLLDLGSACSVPIQRATPALLLAMAGS
jgi:serine/threonine protein kinase